VAIWVDPAKAELSRHEAYFNESLTFREMNIPDKGEI
jgi:hypothetical protein